MKLNNYFIINCIITIALVLNSCEKESTKHIVTDSVVKLDYHGLDVRLPDGYKPEILSYELSDLKSIFNSKREMSIKKSSSEFFITFDELVDLALSVINKYPNTDSLSQTDINLIKEFFIDIDDLTIFENIDIIEDFFESLMRYDYVDTLSKHTPIRLKSSTYLGYDVSKAEFWALVWHPRLVEPTKKQLKKR